MATQTAAKKAAAAPTPSPAPVEHKGIHAALVAFQQEVPLVAKGHTARIPGRNGAPGYSYTYADLADVSDAALPILTRHGLGFVCVPQRTENGSYELVGTLVHTSGETITGALPLAGRQAQELGSSLTYMRRYLLGTMTGIVTDDDDDGQRAQAAKDRTQGEGAPEDQTQAQAPEPQMRPDQQILWDRLAEYGPDQTASVREWWQEQNMPALKNLDTYGVQAVMSYLDEQEQADPSQAR